MLVGPAAACACRRSRLWWCEPTRNAPAKPTLRASAAGRCFEAKKSPCGERKSKRSRSRGIRVYSPGGAAVAKPRRINSMATPSSAPALRVTFQGAARTVTGSMHLVEAGARKLLLDCGLFQGRRAEERERNCCFPFDPRAIDA